MSFKRATQALQDLNDLQLKRLHHGPFLLRAFDLRDNCTFYDALYIIMAETLQVSLITRDRSLASIPGHSADVEVL